MPPIRPPSLTNIGTTTPPRVPLTGPPQVFRPGTGTALPIGLPVAGREGEAQGPQAVANDPLWISRWQPSATVPLSRAPWVRGYRLWRIGVVYQSIGSPLPYNRLDFLWKGHRRAFTHIPEELYQNFKTLTTSVGKWFHENILGPGWKRGSGALFPNFPL